MTMFVTWCNLIQLSVQLRDLITIHSNYLLRSNTLLDHFFHIILYIIINSSFTVILCLQSFYVCTVGTCTPRLHLNLCLYFDPSPKKCG
uniref:Uncharacterized protein n=1 Tax=Anguilla anguilla TaxID=7936 RepID=A0A0E9SCJ3_ANGAN